MIMIVLLWKTGLSYNDEHTDDMIDGKVINTNFYSDVMTSN